MDLNLARAFQAYQQGSYVETREWCGKALKHARAASGATSGVYQPSPLLWYVDGMAALALGETEAAAASLLRSVSLAPHDGNILNDCGLALLKNGQPEEAVAMLKQAVLRLPNVAHPLSNLGSALRQCGLSASAIEPLRQATLLDPCHTAAWHNLGLALLEQGQWSDAEEALSRAVELSDGDDQLSVRLHWIEALRLLEQWERAFDQAHLAYQHAPENAVVVNELGLVLKGLGYPDRAAGAFAEAARLDPGCSAYQAHQAVALYKCGHYADAEHACLQALALDPNDVIARTCQAELLLIAGNYTDGLPAWEARWATAEEQRRYRPATAPEWDGGSYPGATLLVRNEEGVADTLMMARLLTPAARRLGPKSRLIIECQDSLISLLESVAGVHAVIRRGKDWPAHDVQTNLMSLPFVLGLTAETVPYAPYLPAPSVARAWSVVAGEGPVIGLCWAAGNAPGDVSVPLSELWTALQQGVAGRPVRWVCLQGDEQRTLAASLSGMQMPPPPRTFSETAGVMGQLDAVVSVDSAILHLAGALGVPLAALLGVGCHWRYGLPGTSSPWYPEAALFRQSSLGDWTQPLAGLSQWVAQQLDGWFIARRKRWW